MLQTVNSLIVLFLLTLLIPSAEAAQSNRILLTMPPILAAKARPAPLPPGTVISAGGRVWMDRNLGASRVATSSTDSASYGDLYQWGRLTDGHERRTSPTTLILSPTDVPGHGSFIVVGGAWEYRYDWRIQQNDNLWQNVSGTNNPCPSGFRLPTSAEWDIESASWSKKDPAGAFGSPLKLVLAGHRSGYDGSLRWRNITGKYWSSTGRNQSQCTGPGVGDYQSCYLGFRCENCGYDDEFEANRSHGLSVRCIKD